MKRCRIDRLAHPSAYICGIACLCLQPRPPGYLATTHHSQPLCCRDSPRPISHSLSLTLPVLRCPSAACPAGYGRPSPWSSRTPHCGRRSSPSPLARPCTSAPPWRSISRPNPFPPLPLPFFRERTGCNLLAPSLPVNAAVSRDAIFFLIFNFLIPVPSPIPGCSLQMAVCFFGPSPSSNTTPRRRGKRSQES